MQSCIFATDCAHLPADAGGARIETHFGAIAAFSLLLHLRCRHWNTLQWLHSALFQPTWLVVELHQVHRLQGRVPVRSTELPWCDYRDGLPHWRLRAQGHQQRSTTLREEEPWNFIPHPDPDWGVVASSSGKYLSVQQNRYHFCAPGIFWTQWSENIHSL